MAASDPKIGIWRAVGEFKFAELVWPEGTLALLIGAGGAVAVIYETTLKDRAAVTGDLLILSGAFLAVVFTALAIVVSLPSSSYLRLLGETPGGGMRRFLDPYLIAVGTQIGVILLTLVYRLVATRLPASVEHVGFGLMAFMFIYGLLDIAALARQLVRHGIYRAADAGAELDAEASSGRVSRLPTSRGS